MKTPMPTESRIFANRLTREIKQNERVNAAILAPGTTTWPKAIDAYWQKIKAADGPVKRAKLIKIAFERLRSTSVHSCLIYAYHQRTRTAFVEFFTFEVDRHPYAPEMEGIAVRSYAYFISRRGAGCLRPNTVAFVSWHALGRLHQRSNDSDTVAAIGTIGLCGMCAAMLQDSLKFRDTELNLAMEDIVATGVLRKSVDSGLPVDDAAPAIFEAFFDVKTMLREDMVDANRLKQGRLLAGAVIHFLEKDKDEARAFAEKEIPARRWIVDDYVSGLLKNGGI